MTQFDRVRDDMYAQLKSWIEQYGVLTVILILMDFITEEIERTQTRLIEIEATMKKILQDIP